MDFWGLGSELGFVGSKSWCLKDCLFEGGFFVVISGSTTALNLDFFNGFLDKLTIQNLYNHYQPPATFDHHQPPPITTNHHQLLPATTNHLQPLPTTTNHHQPPPTTSNPHQPPQPPPTTTNHHQLPPTTSNHRLLQRVRA